jgi:hypothetical protein
VLLLILPTLVQLPVAVGAVAEVVAVQGLLLVLVKLQVLLDKAVQVKQAEAVMVQLVVMAALTVTQVLLVVLLTVQAVVLVVLLLVAMVVQLARYIGQELAHSLVLLILVQ